MKKNYSGFTFVELIIVLVILTILATIGFTVYENYLGTGRDAKRIVTLREISNSFQDYQIRSRLPLPEAAIELTASGVVYGYQGNLSEDISKSVGYRGDVLDSEYDIYPSYTLTENRNDFQFLTFLEDRQNLLTAQSAYANYDFRLLFPKTYGKSLGIFIDSESYVPIQLIDTFASSGSLDIAETQSGLTVYLSDSKTLDSERDILTQLHPKSSCKRILELGKAQGSGVYTIVPDGITPLQAYCDMRTDGGGWTLIGRGREDWGWNNDGKDTGRVGIGIGKQAAFAPAYLSSGTIDSLLGGKFISNLEDGLRIRRYSHLDNGEYQELRWIFSNQESWSWLFDSSISLSDTIIDGISRGSGNTRDDSNGGNDFRRVFTWAGASHAGKTGFSYGSSVDNGSSDSSSYLWENGNEGHAVPYTEVYIRK